MDNGTVIETGSESESESEPRSGTGTECNSLNEQELMNGLVRKLALLILDEPNGIAETHYNTLKKMLTLTKDIDIIDNVEIINERVFINEDFAEDSLKFLKYDVGNEI